MIGTLDYTAQTLNGWIYQVMPGHHGHYLEVWNPGGRGYRRPKPFNRYEEAIAFAQSLIELAHQRSGRATYSEDSVKFDQMMGQFFRMDSRDFVYREWHVKSYEDSDEDWDLYGIDPILGSTQICLKRQADLQKAIAQIKAQIDVIEAMRYANSLSENSA